MRETKVRIWKWKWGSDNRGMFLFDVLCEVCFVYTCLEVLLSAVDWTLHRNHKEIATKVKLTSRYNGSNPSIEVLSSYVTLNCVKLAKLTSVYELHYYRIYSPNHALDRGYLRFFIFKLFLTENFFFTKP